MSKPTPEGIAIVGIGAVMPQANDAPAFWRNILDGRDSIAEIPAERWDWRLYYDADPKAKDKTYSKIGAFVQDFRFDPLKYRIPPGVAAQMDTVQQLAVAATQEALADAGYGAKSPAAERTAVILGNAMGGPKRSMTDLRVYTAFIKEKLSRTASFGSMGGQAKTMLAELDRELDGALCAITEDSMPGELSNVIAGRVANVFNFNGPNFTVDAACASSLAALDMAVKGLRLGDFDVAVCGGVDQMMGPPDYIKFSKIGALSADGSRPFDAGANGFVMGEGAGIMILKRLSDARRDGDRIYAVIRSVGASSDGKGKGITAPNPKGQKLAIERAFADAGYGPDAVGLVEAHGTSTKVGDATEIQVLNEVFGGHAAPGSVGLGSVKSQIGHLKAAAGAAGMIKTAFALYHKILPPSINFQIPNPGVDWAKSPFAVVTAAAEWKSGKPRRANVSAFGFGGTNFHVALEEDHGQTERTPDLRALAEEVRPLTPAQMKQLQGEAFVVGGETPEEVKENLKKLSINDAEIYPLFKLAGPLNAAAKPRNFTTSFQAESPAKLKEKLDLLGKALAAPDAFTKPPIQLKPKGIHLGTAKAGRPKIGFLFPGQGSQYVDMVRDLRDKYTVVRETFDEADRLMEPVLGKKLSSIIFSPEGASPEAVKAQEEILKQTEYTQPAVLAADVAILRLLRAYGLEPDVVCGHSLGEYGALVAAGVLEFKDALLAVSARAKEMASVKVPDPGKMASIALPAEKVESTLAGITGYVAVANKNCPSQTVIAGETAAVEEAVGRFSSEGVQAQEIRVSHAFHSKIVAPAQEAYGKVLDRLGLKAPTTPILSNVTADYYPRDVREIHRLLVEQIAAPVEFTRQIERMYADGVRLFVEVGPKRVLSAFVGSILEGKSDAVALASNHPKRGGIVEFNDVLARLAVEGVPLKFAVQTPEFYEPSFRAWAHSTAASEPARPAAAVPSAPLPQDLKAVLDRFGFNLNPVVVSGVAAGAPGGWDKLFREGALDEILRGQNMIEKLPEDEQRLQIDKNIVRLIKSETGDHRLERIDTISDVIKLCARAGEFDVEEEFGLPSGLARALDRSSQMAIAAGLLALRDAGLPLVRVYKETTTGSRIPTGWALPEALQAETGVIFASAFPGIDSLIDEVARHLADKFSGRPLRELEALVQDVLKRVKDPQDKQALETLYAQHLLALRQARGGETYQFSREFLLRVLSMGHSQMSQWIRAKGPSVQINLACASTTTAIAMAEDWIRLGRCRRVLVVGADDITNSRVQEWFISGFLAAGAATTEASVSKAALPFDRRRHGMIVGAGAIGLVVEDAERVKERGMRALAEVLATTYENSAFHATRLDTRHVAEVMDRVVATAEKRHGLDRKTMAPKTLFMSHETYTPARGGSASAEVEALKRTYGAQAGQVIVCNTKGFTGHTMGASLEDPVAIRAMTTGKVPPIANYKEPDPELAGIRLSDGGEHDLEYALRLGAGFGSQIAISLMRRLCRKDEPRIADPALHRRWLAAVSGIENPELEVVKNTLRVKDTLVGQGGTPKRAPEPVRANTPHPNPLPQAGEGAPKNSPLPLVGEGARRAGEGSNATAVAEAPSAGAPTDEASVRAKILQLVSEKTGYPAEMLELDLDMEADLGIDTVKQAELFGMVRETYGLPRVEGLSIKNYPTLRHVIRFAMEGGGTPPIPSPSMGEGEGGGEAVAVQPAAPPSQPSSAESNTAAPEGALDAAAVQAEIVKLVSEKTGYPAEMLELDLDMEADLGIDTVKQAELFGMVREKYQIPRRENLSLKDYPTLRHVLRFVLEGRAAANAVEPVTTAMAVETAAVQAAPAPAETPLPQTAVAAPHPHPLPTGARAPETAKSGFKRYVLRARAAEARGTKLALDGNVLVVGGGEMGKVFEKDLKCRGARVFHLGDSGRTVGDYHRVKWEEPETILEAVKAAEASGPVAGIIYLPGAENLGPDFDASYKRAVLPLFTLAKALSKAPRWAAALTRVGAAHGQQAPAPFDPLAGAVTGLTKALSKEWPEAIVKALDFDPAESAGTCVQRTMEELASGDRSTEVGWHRGRRCVLELEVRPPAGQPEEIPASTVFLVTGGGQGLGAELSKALASRTRAKFAVLGRTALGPDAARWAAMTSNELKAMKAELWTKLKAANPKATPVQLEKEFSQVTKAAEVWRNLQAMRNAGAEAEYYSCDLADPAAAATAARTVLARFGQVDVLVHAAGLEESKLLADKTPEAFHRVFAAKAHGAQHLLAALPEGRRRYLFFSSIAGRFGNAGQTDYAAASDYLNKLAVSLRAKGQIAVSVGLTAISEIGMATRGGVETVLKSAGVQFMPPSVCVEFLIDELTRRAPDAEILLTGDLGKMAPERVSVPEAKPEPSRPTASKLSSRLTAAAPSPAAKAASRSPLEMVKAGARAAAPEPEAFAPTGALIDRGEKKDGAVVIHKTFSTDSDPYLSDHAIDGTPLVPGVMGVELFAETLAAAGTPTRALRTVRFALPIKLLRLKPQAVRAVLKAGKKGPELEIESDFLMPNGQRLGAPRQHFTALPDQPEGSLYEKLGRPGPMDGAYAVLRKAVYEAYFHGPSFQVLDGVIHADENGVKAVYKRPEKPLWAAPKGLLMQPLLIEAAFQACGFRDLHVAKKMTLPDAIARVRVLETGEAPEKLYIAAAYRGADDEGKSLYDAVVYDAQGRSWVELEGFRMIPVQ